MKLFNLRNFLKTVFFVIILVFVFAYVSGFLRDGEARFKKKEFLTECNQFDVLFFGSSHAELSVSPLELWNKYGIASYNFGTHGQCLPITYWVIKDAININKPRIVILDTYMFGYGDEFIDGAAIHSGLDSFPLNKTKIAAINDMTDDNRLKMEIIFPFGYYHSRWKDLNKDSLSDYSFYMKGNLSYGYYFTTGVNQYKQHTIIGNQLPDNGDYEIGIDYLKRIIELCKSENIDIILFNAPYICNEGQQKINNLVSEIASDNNIPYIDMVRMDSIIDTNTDMCDPQHVNQSGLQKVTEYIGSYISEKYDLKDHRDDDKYSSWDESYNDYKMLKFEFILWQDDLDISLMMLHDTDISSVVYYNGQYRGEDKDKINSLMQNIARNNITVDNIDIKSEYLRPLVKYDDNWEHYILINDTGSVYEITGVEAKTKINEILDDFTDEALNYDAVIVAIDKESGEVRLIQGYNFDESGYKSEILYHSIRFKYLFDND